MKDAVGRKRRPERVLLEHVAALCGVEPQYEDVFGERHEVDDAVLKALLESLGFSAATRDDLVQTLQTLQARAFRQVVEPVQVVPVGTAPIAVVLSFPESLERARYRWRLRREDGWETLGEGRIDALQGVDEREGPGGRLCRRLLYVHEPVECGYHDLEVFLGTGPSEMAARQRLIVVPRRAYVPGSLAGEKKTWGLTAQLYGIRSERNWGIGSFSDLRALIDWAADVGAGFVGTNPLWLLFPEDPSKVSPYGPSSRRFLQPWYVDVEAIPEFWESEEGRRWFGDDRIRRAWEAARRTALVDYDTVWSIQREALEKLYAHFRKHHLEKDSERAQSFRRFVENGGKDLQSYGVFHALDAHFRRSDPALWGWPLWPGAYHDPASSAVAAFAAEHGETVTFFLYVAWNAWEQLSACGRRSWERGLAVGLYGDLPVGVDPAGLDTWLAPSLFALKTRIGAPPDDFNPKGQEWGVCPFLPQALKDAAYEPFIAMLRANMRDFGALRIDHVMGLMRQFWIPAGLDARHGAYVRYPFEDLLGLVLLESERNRCLVVGEDLGTVPDRVRTAMEESRLFGCRLCFFERLKDGSFPPPENYPPFSVASFSTHDLPTLEGFWQGQDLRVRESLDLFPSEDVREKMLLGRKADQKALRALLSAWGYEEEESDATGVPDDENRTHRRAAAVYRYLAASGSKLLAVSLEDLCGVADQVNVPGTVTEHPNWRRKLPWDVETLKTHSRVQAILSAVTEKRPRES
ncbi:4-alpha-glucanotransferase [Desulfosoma sp.]